MWNAEQTRSEIYLNFNKPFLIYFELQIPRIGQWLWKALRSWKWNKHTNQIQSKRERMIALELKTKDIFIPHKHEIHISKNILTIKEQIDREKSPRNENCPVSCDFFYLLFTLVNTEFCFWIVVVIVSCIQCRYTWLFTLCVQFLVYCNAIFIINLLILILKSICRTEFRLQFSRL